MTGGIGDDAAVVEPQRGTLDVLTTDTLVEGVHFDQAFVSPADVGHKTLAVNQSDLAAMGAAPRVALLSFSTRGLPAGVYRGTISFDPLANKTLAQKIEIEMEVLPVRLPDRVPVIPVTKLSRPSIQAVIFSPTAAL